MMKPSSALRPTWPSLQGKRVAAFIQPCGTTGCGGEVPISAKRTPTINLLYRMWPHRQHRALPLYAVVRYRRHRRKGRLAHRERLHFSEPPGMGPVGAAQAPMADAE